MKVGSKMEKLATMKPTSISELKAYAKGSLIELPPFAEDQPFVARLIRPSLINLVSSGKIPNQLLATANELFTGKSSAKAAKGDNQLKQFKEVLDVIAEASFVEPTYQEIKDSGLELTDDQYVFIFNYSQHGVNALKSFRKK